ERIEHRRIRRQFQIAHVGMPDSFAGAERADRLAFVVEHVGDHVDVRISRRTLPAAFLIWWRIEIAEAPAESEQVVVAEFLPAEEHHRTAVPSRFDLCKFCCAQGREIDISYFHANHRCQWPYCHRHEIILESTENAKFNLCRPKIIGQSISSSQRCWTFFNSATISFLTSANARQGE